MSYHTKKRFGQHFLNDGNVIQQIVAAFAPEKTDNIVEIGPGLGALTTVILPYVDELNVIELDRDVIPRLIARCKNIGNLIVHSEDVLRFDFSKLTHEKPMRLIGNLPYNIATQLIFILLEHVELIQNMMFMLQDEVAERIVAKPNTKAYGRLSIMVQYFCQATKIFTIPPDAFSPPPKVNSAIILLTPHKTLPYVANDFTHFADVVRLAFNMRRKTLRNSLRDAVTAEQLESLSISPTARAEQLTIEDFVRIANLI